MVYNEKPLLHFMIPITVIIGLISIHGIYTFLHDGLFLIYSRVPISRTSRENVIWFEKSGVPEIEGGIKLRLIGRILFDYE